LIFVGERLKHALKPYTDCWKRAAFIIGAALAGRDSVPRLKDLMREDVESLGDALGGCGVDYYLLVGDEIPPLIRYLTKDHAYALAEAFVDKYDEAVAEIKRVLYIARNRGSIYDAEGFYGLGLASIIAKAVEPGKPSDANAAFRIVSSAIKHVVSAGFIKPLLSALVPLRDKAPQRYLEVLAFALDKVSAPDILGFMSPNLDTVMYILNEFDYILNKYGDGVKGHVWTLVRAIIASINSLYKHLELCDDYRDYWDASFRRELERIASRVAGLLNEIDRLNPSLGIIAWAHVLPPALNNKCVRALMESVLGIDVVNEKAKEVAGGLSRLRDEVQELIRDEDFMGFVKSWLAETDEEAVREEILEESSNLKYAWAQYKLDNDELYEAEGLFNAEDLFNEAARESREIGDYQNYLDSSNWALRAKAIRSKLASDELVKLVDEFRQLYEEAKKQRNTLLLSDILGGYLVSLALKGGDEEIRRIEELLKEEWRGPGRYSLASILTRLTLNALLSPRGELSGELKDKLVVKPGELIMALGGGDIDINSLPALRAIYGTIKRGDEKKLCDELNDDLFHDLCMHLVSRVIDYIEELDQRGEGYWRQALINHFKWWISKGEMLDLLKKLGLDAESLENELKGLIHELSVKSLPELVSHCLELEQRRCSSAHLTYMLYALINGNEKLAKAHALYGAVSVTRKLPARLFLEAYRACCDPNNDGFKRAIAKLFFYHI
jgi:hypothetical protein